MEGGKIKTLICGIATLIILSLCSSVFASEITLAWDANTEPDLAGYNIYWGTASQDYVELVDVRTATSGRNVACPEPYDPFKAECCEYALELAPGTYYFAATAYDEEGNESAFSDELTHTFVDITPPGSPKWFRFKDVKESVINAIKRVMAKD